MPAGCYGRSVTENILCMQQCDAVVCTDEGIGITTLIEKVKDFKTVTGDFPMYEQGLLWSQYGTYVRSR